MIFENDEVREGKEIYDLACKLFPICRSITGEGVRKTLRIINEYIKDDQMVITEVPSGSKVFDWVVPKEWKIEDAYIKNEDGEKIVDFKKNNLYVMGYSLPIDRWVDYNELDTYIYTLKKQPEVIPYVTSYYKERTGFCMSENLRQSLPKGRYYLKIDSELFDGSLTYGEVIIKGKQKKEVFITTYVCHPSMANNETSGPCLAAYLIKYLKQLPEREYTYRFVFAPETIGAVAYLAVDNHMSILKQNVIAAFNLTCVGDNRNYSFIESRYGGTLSDRAIESALKSLVGESYIKYSYLDRGSDERQYGAPGVDLPIVAFCRTKFNEYPEYHTSADDMSVISPLGFQGSFNVMRLCIELIEKNKKYITTVFCEPQLGKRGLYDTISKKGEKNSKIYQDILAYSDGRNDLLELIETTKGDAKKVIEAIDILLQEGLVRVFE